MKQPPPRWMIGKAEFLRFVEDFFRRIGLGGSAAK
jgi:hypothetical protein